MPTPSPARLRGFVRRHTRLMPVPGVPGVRIYTADDVMTLCGLAGRELGQADPPLPYWAFPWAGGLAVARYLLDRPDEVAGRVVLDLAAGSGICGIVALQSGAEAVSAVDIDPLAEAAVALNARANDVRIAFTRRDLLADAPPACDVILAGDVCYEERMAVRMVEWLRLAARTGTRVLLGDPGRTYLPDDLVHLATYEVETTRELEDRTIKPSAVYAIASEISPAGNR